MPYSMAIDMWGLGVLIKGFTPHFPPPGMPYSMAIDMWSLGVLIKGFAPHFPPPGMPYSMAIDMWSLGCILAELYTGYPLFPGENEVEQLSCIMEIFGVPSLSVLRDAQRKKLFFGELY